MNWAHLRKKLLPHLLIIAIFMVVSSVFLLPVIKDGKVLKQNDVTQWAGSYQETKAYMDTSGIRTLWTNSMFGGMPTYQIAPYSPNIMIGTIYVYNTLVSGWTLPVPINAIFLYCFSFYMLMLAFRVNPWLSMIGALAYAFGSFNIIIIEAGHMLQAYALGTAPLVLAAMVFTIREKKYVFGGAMFALAFAIHLRTSHVQMTYYLGFILAIYMVAELIMHIQRKDLKPYLFSAALFIFGGIIALATTATLQLTTLEYSKETIRGRSELTPPKTEDGNQAAPASTGLDPDYAFSHSYTPGESFTLMIPNFRGGTHGLALQNEEYEEEAKSGDPAKQVAYYTDAYWGGQLFTSGPVYLGAIICFLFLLGMLLLKGRDRWWILAVAILSLMLAWGKYFGGLNLLLFEHLPMYNKFRSVAFTLVMAGMVFPLLAMLVLNKLIRQKPEWNKEFRQKFFIAGGITAGLCLLFFIMPSLGGDFQKPEDPLHPERTITTQNQIYQTLLYSFSMDEQQIQQVMQQNGNTIASELEEGRASVLSNDAGRSLLFILLAGALIFLYVRGTVKKEILIAGIGVLIMADLWPVAKRFLNEKNFERKRTESSKFIPTQADNYILKDKDPNYRVMNLTKDVFNDATVSYFHKNVGGYHGAKLRRFQEFREYYLDRLIGVMKQNMGQIPPQTLVQMLEAQGQMKYLNMLNTKYLITGQDAQSVVENPGRLGNAWFVQAVRRAKNADEEMGMLADINPRDTAVVNDALFAAYKTEAVFDSAATIALTEYRPNHLTYKSDAASPQFAVFSEVYYDSGLGWNAYLDGNKVPHVRADWLLRGMNVPAGQHVIEFKFEPKTYATGEKITLVASLILLLGVIGAIAFELRQAQIHSPKKIENNGEEA